MSYPTFNLLLSHLAISRKIPHVFLVLLKVSFSCHGFDMFFVRLEHLLPSGNLRRLKAINADVFFSMPAYTDWYWKLFYFLTKNSTYKFRFLHVLFRKKWLEMDGCFLTKVLKCKNVSSSVCSADHFQAPLRGFCGRFIQKSYQTVLNHAQKWQIHSGGVIASKIAWRRSGQIVFLQ